MQMSGLRPFFSRYSLFCYEDVRALPLFFHGIRCFVTKMSGLRPFFSRHSLLCYEDVRAPPLFLLPVVLLGRCQGSAPFLVACCFVTKLSGLRPFSCCLLFCYEDEI